MRVIQSRLFEKTAKKFTKTQKRQLDAVILEILQNPSAGEKKKGDLANIFVYKFKINHSLYILAYRFSDTLLELIMLGQHENYYRTLKKYVQNR